MTLSEWLATNGKTQTWLAGQVGLSTAQMSRVVRGSQQASTVVAYRIEVITRGAVTVADLHAVRVQWLAAHGRLDAEAAE